MNIDFAIGITVPIMGNALISLLFQSQSLCTNSLAKMTIIILTLKHRFDYGLNSVQKSEDEYK